MENTGLADYFPIKVTIICYVLWLSKFSVGVSCNY
jgi:hypothetical protein